MTKYKMFCGCSSINLIQCTKQKIPAKDLPGIVSFITYAAMRVGL